MKVLMLAVCMLVAGAQSANLVEKAEELGATILVRLLDTAGLKDAIATGGPFTVFAPTNEAFESLPDYIVDYLHKNKTALSEILKYHVVKGAVFAKTLTNDQLQESLQGKSVRINIYETEGHHPDVTVSGRRIIRVDEIASNGVIHLIDQVMMPPVGNVVDLVKAVPHFSTLLKAVGIAGLGNVLAGDGPFTVFAPSNDAFEKIPKEELDALLADKDRLTAVLKYHVVAGTVYSAGIHDGAMVPTLDSDHKLDIHRDHHGIFINHHARVFFPDVTVTNGAVHVIDNVLLPPKRYSWTKEAQEMFSDPHLFFN